MDKLKVKKIFKIIKNNPEKFSLTLLFDFVFLSIMQVLDLFVRKLIPQQPEQITTLFTDNIRLVFLLLITYIVITLLIYSFFKYIILLTLYNMFKKRRFRLKEYKDFCILNLILYVFLFFVIFLVIGMSFTIFKISFSYLITTITYLVLLLVFYIYLNTTHSLFINKQPLTKILKNGWLVLKNIRAYLPICVFSIIALLSIFAINILTTAILKDFILIRSIVLLILFYSLIAFNRVYFLVLIKDVLPQH